MHKTSLSQKIRIIVSIVIILIGVGIGCVPIVAPMISQQYQNEVITRYRNKIASMSDGELAKAKEEAKKYNETGKSNYYTAIDAGTVISYIEIPKINVYLPIFKGTDDKTLERGIGLLENTAFPIGGLGTHCVLSGHSGLITQKMFTDLGEMKAGDLFFLHTYDETLCYKVYDLKVVLPEEVKSYIKFETDKDYCTLLTCTPIGVNTHRLLVMGERTDYEEDVLSTEETTVVSSSHIERETEAYTEVVPVKIDYRKTHEMELLVSAAISIILQIIGVIIFAKTVKEIRTLG